MESESSDPPCERLFHYCFGPGCGADLYHAPCPAGRVLAARSTSRCTLCSSWCLSLSVRTASEIMHSQQHQAEKHPDSPASFKLPCPSFVWCRQVSPDSRPRSPGDSEACQGKRERGQEGSGGVTTVDEEGTGGCMGCSTARQPRLFALAACFQCTVPVSKLLGR